MGGDGNIVTHGGQSLELFKFFADRDTLKRQGIAVDLGEFLNKLLRQEVKQQYVAGDYVELFVKLVMHLVLDHLLPERLVNGSC